MWTVHNMLNVKERLEKYETYFVKKDNMLKKK